MIKAKITKYKNNLKKDQIEKITADFDSDNLSNTEIIKKYKLPILPSELRYILPMKETKTICPYCGEYMYCERIRKKEKYIKKVCLLCNHIIYPEDKLYLKCTCENCMFENEKRKEELKKLIEEIFSKNEKVKWEDIDLEDMVKLFMIFCINPKANTKTINKAEKYVGETYYELIDDLYKKKIILISPESNAEAFHIENNEIFFDEEKVIWNVNILFDDEVLKVLNNKKFPIDAYNIKEKRKYLKKIIMGQLITDVQLKMNERGHSFNPTTESIIRYTKLIEELSYTQIEYLNYKTVMSTCDFYKVKGYSYATLEKTILNYICDSAERYKNNGWEIYKSNPNYIADKLRLIIEQVFNEKVEILNKSIKDILS